MLPRPYVVVGLVSVVGVLWACLVADVIHTRAADPPLVPEDRAENGRVASTPGDAAPGGWSIVGSSGLSAELPSFCQEPDQETHNGYAFVHSDAAFGSRAAESFALPAAGLVERVEWWGTYLVDAAIEPCDPGADDFTVTIYADAAGTPGVVVSTNDLGARASRTRTSRVISYVQKQYDEYHFAADLLEPFIAQGGVTYWVEIVRGDVDGCNWRWETSPPGADGDGSVLWDYGPGGYEKYNFDLAFCLSGQPPSFCQVPDQITHAGFAFVHSDTALDSRAAESFVSPGTGLVDRVHWWGSYFDFNQFPEECAPDDDDFTLTVYADAGGMPGAAVSTNALLGRATRISTGQTVSWFGRQYTEYEFAADLLEPFPADAGATYWVEIVRDAYDVDGCMWWWSTAPRGTSGDGSALWDEGHGDGYETFNFDLAMCVRLSPDCNENRIRDALDIADRTSSDCNGTSVPDECEAIGDYDGDGDVDWHDFGRWDGCMTGPEGGPNAPGCAPFDLDTDEDTDLLDYAGFQVLFGCSR